MFCLLALSLLMRFVAVSARERREAGPSLRPLTFSLYNSERTEMTEETEPSEEACEDAVESEGVCLCVFMSKVYVGYVADSDFSRLKRQSKDKKIIIYHILSYPTRSKLFMGASYLWDLKIFLTAFAFF